MQDDGADGVLKGVGALLEAAGLGVARAEPMPHGLYLLEARQRNG